MNKSNFTVSIIIPAYNNLDLLKKNLPEIIKAKDRKENNILEIVVVDDGSSDSSYEFVKKEFSEVKIIKHKVNRGFSSAVNTGARSAAGKLLALINTDVVPQSDFLAEVFKHFDDEKVFAVSLHEEGYGWARCFFKDGFIVHGPGPESKNPHESFWVNGGSGVFRRDIWMKLGGLDEKLLNPFYWEDIDLCYRALKRGYRLFWEPKAMVTHEHEQTVGKLDKTKTSRVQERNQLIFIWKNLTSQNLFKKHIAGLLRRISRHPGYLRIVLMAIFRIKEILKARRKEEKESKVSDEAILAKYA